MIQQLIEYLISTLIRYDWYRHRIIYSYTKHTSEKVNHECGIFILHCWYEYVGWRYMFVWYISGVICEQFQSQTANLKFISIGKTIFFHIMRFARIFLYYESSVTFIIMVLTLIITSCLVYSSLLWARGALP